MPEILIPEHVDTPTPMPRDRERPRARRPHPLRAAPPARALPAGPDSVGSADVIELIGPNDIILESPALPAPQSSLKQLPAARQPSPQSPLKQLPAAALALVKRSSSTPVLTENTVLVPRRRRRRARDERSGWGRGQTAVFVESRANETRTCDAALDAAADADCAAAHAAIAREWSELARTSREEEERARRSRRRVARRGYVAAVLALCAVVVAGSAIALVLSSIRRPALADIPSVSSSSLPPAPAEPAVAPPAPPAAPDALERALVSPSPSPAPPKRPRPPVRTRAPAASVVDDDGADDEGAFRRVFTEAGFGGAR